MTLVERNDGSYLSAGEVSFCFVSWAVTYLRHWSNKDES